MAKSKALFSIPFTLTLLFIFSHAAAVKQPHFYQRISPTSLGLQEEKLTQLHFFFHDIVSGPRPTAVTVAQSQMAYKSSTDFGDVRMADDPLTVGPEPDSGLVGWAQGIYASASQEEVGFLMLFNFVFTQGEFNGSTLSLLGRNAIFSGLREMSIVGGSKAFRFTRGYAQAKTYWANLTSGDAIVEYNVYVFHYY